MSMRKSLGLMSFLLVLAFFYSNWLCQPPDPLPDSVSPALFSAERAMIHVREIARSPHPMGTPEHARVREYIISVMTGLGYETEVSESSLLIPHQHVFNGGRILNVVARMPGRRNDRAVMVVGHYDTQPNTPGAADDSSAVAAMLEAARALKSEPPLENDLVFLFTDAEEIGMVGAEAFVRENPLASQVGLVLNLEARGNGGVAFTFETSSQNGWIMSEYAKAMSYPFAGSVMYEIYKRMPNNTDFTVFKNAGMAGFNAAFIEGFVNYHAMSDTPEGLDRRSLQHHGQTIMDVAGHFGRLKLSEINAPDRVFFNPAGSWLWVFPFSWQTILLVAVAGMMLLVIVLALKRSRVSIASLLSGIVLYPLAVGLGLGLVYLGRLVFIMLYPLAERYYSMNMPGVVDFFWVFAALGLLGFLVLYRWLQKKINIESMSLGALFILTLMGIGLYVFMPTGAYALLYPVLLPLLVWALILLFRIDEDRSSRLMLILILLSLMPAVFFLTPLVKMMFIVFSVDLVIAAVALLLILAGIVLPWLSFLCRQWAKPLFGVLLVAVLTFSIIGHVRSRPTPSRPLHSNLNYFLDGDSDKAFWASRFSTVDPGNAEYFPNPRYEPFREFFPNLPQRFLKADAPLADLPTLTWAMSADETDDAGRRTVSARIRSERGAPLLQLFMPAAPVLLSLAIDGKSLTLPKGEMIIRYHGLPAEGIELCMVLSADQPLVITAMDISWGFPDLLWVKPFPPGLIPDTGYLSRVTLVKRTLCLQGTGAMGPTLSP